jgi:hypothetical protein
VAELAGNLWSYNLVKLLIVDVTDDYRLMQPPLPSSYYPVLREVWLPKHLVTEHLKNFDLLPGYLYDWHEHPAEETGIWYVGVVDESLTHDPMFALQFGSA